jgi:hypothetical protein
MFRSPAAVTGGDRFVWSAVSMPLTRHSGEMRPNVTRHDGNYFAGGKTMTNRRVGSTI